MMSWTSSATRSSSSTSSTVSVIAEAGIGKLRFQHDLIPFCVAVLEHWRARACPIPKPLLASREGGFGISERRVNHRSRRNRSTRSKPLSEGTRRLRTSFMQPTAVALHRATTLLRGRSLTFREEQDPYGE